MSLASALSLRGAIAAGNRSRFGSEDLPDKTTLNPLDHVTLFDLHPTQQQVLEDLERFNVVVAGRRWGKSRLGLWVGSLAALGLIEKLPDYPSDPVSPPVVLFAMPTLKQCKKIFWRPLVNILSGNPMVKRIDRSDLIIEFKHEHPPLFFSGLNDGDGDRVRGLRIACLIADEWQDVKPDIWEEVLRPAMADTPGSVALFTGTPKGKANHLKKFYDYGETQPGWASHRFKMRDNPHVSVEEIDRMALTMDPRTFRQEAEGSFEDFPGQFFTYLDENALQRPPKAFQKIVLGVDWGDINPALVVCARDNDECWWVLDTWYQGGPEEVSYATLLGAAQSFVKTYGVGRAWAGHDRPASISEWNKQLGCPCKSWQDARPHRTTRHPSASEAISLLSNLCHKRRLKLESSLEDLYGKLKGYHRKRSKYGEFLDEPADGQDDHEVDAIRYAIGSEEFGWTPKTGVRRGVVRR